MKKIYITQWQRDGGPRVRNDVHQEEDPQEIWQQTGNQELDARLLGQQQVVLQQVVRQQVVWQQPGWQIP